MAEFTRNFSLTAFGGVISAKLATATNQLTYALNTWLVANARLVGENANDGRIHKKLTFTIHHSQFYIITPFVIFEFIFE